MPVGILSKVLGTISPNSFQMPKHASVSAYCFSTPYWLNFAVAFPLPLSTPCSDGARLQPGIWWKKGSFLRFWISCFCKLPGVGVGWLQHSPLSRTGLTTLMWPCFAPLLCPAMRLFLQCMTFDVPLQ